MIRIMKKLAFLFLVSVLTLTVTSNAQIHDYSIEFFNSGTVDNPFPYQGDDLTGLLTCYNSPSPMHEQTILTQIWDVIDIDTIEMWVSDLYGFAPYGWQQEEKWWKGGKFWFLTMDEGTNGYVEVKISDFELVYPASNLGSSRLAYTTPIKSVYGALFMYDEHVEIETHQLTRQFAFFIQKSELVSSDGLGELEDSIVTLNATNTLLTDSIVGLNTIITELNTTVDSLTVENVLLTDSIVTLNATNTLLTDSIEGLTIDLNTANDYNATLLASVDSMVTLTQSYQNDSLPAAYDNGWAVGYDLGFEDGVASVDTLVIWTNGYNAGLEDCEGDTTSVNTSITPVDVNVYPNPVNVSDALVIEATDFSHVEVYTTTGVLMMSETNQTLDVSWLSSGLYLVKVYDTYGRMATSKVTVQE